MDDQASHYDDVYFQWQSALGAFTGEMEAAKFAPHIRQSDAVLDFGCGGGFLLHSLNCSQKVGVEINPAGRQFAQRLGIDVVASIFEVSDASFDVVVSNHALEHVRCPYDVIKAVFDKLRPGGMAVFVVPCERYDTKYKPENIDRHLYTWSPMNLGNLFHLCGYDIKGVKRIPHRWPPYIQYIDRLLGRSVCNGVCVLYGLARPKLTQIQIVAQKPLFA
jgi:SAM-dependent methyltransferase